MLGKTKLLSDDMLVAAVTALADEAPTLKDPKKGLVPDVDQARSVSVKIARAVIRQAQKENLTTVENLPEEDAELEEWIKAQMWDLVYRKYKRIE